jgi:kynurenine formamidase
MRLMRPLVLLLALLGTAGCARAPAPEPDRAPAPLFPAGTIVDLSHPYDAKTVYWPTSEPFAFEKLADGMTPQGYYYAANRFSTSEHGGTHIDAPVHFAQGRHTVDAIPLDQLMGPAIVVDVTAQAAADRDYRVTTADLETWEKSHGRIPDNSIVLLRTGFSRHWPDAAAYLGTAERGPDAVAKLHFPGLHPDAAKWLVDNRRIKAVGLDTASIDYGQSALYESHRALMERNIPAFENLTNLDRLPVTGGVVVALPMKIGGGSGGPLRAIGIVP